MRKLAIAFVLTALWGTAAPMVVAATAAPLTHTELLARERPVATKRIRYGALPGQFGELWLPDGPGRHPVVILIHGGCWLASLPGLELMAYAADDLRKHGSAVWNIEYRRLGEPGGGYPGSFEDVANAVDWLRTLAKDHPLDLDDVVAAGHSAGGHLALWAAARPRLPKRSPLYRDNPLPIKRAVSLASINDLALFHDRGPPSCGGPRTIEQLVGVAARGPWDAYADTSPAALLPLGVPQTVISAALDPIVPAAFGRAYAAGASAAGDRVVEITIPQAGHFELIDPRSGAFEQVRSALRPARQ
ncbi:MAG: alpha/beta hydrolase family protein [Pseudolabrys sp.]